MICQPNKAFSITPQNSIKVDQPDASTFAHEHFDLVQAFDQQ